MKKIKIKKILMLGLTVIVGLITFGIYAYAGYQPLEPTVAGSDLGNNYGGYFKRIYELGIAIAGILAVLYIVIGGFQYMMTEAVFTKAEAKNKILSAIMGLILALGSWLLLNTIDSRFVNFDLKLPKSSFFINTNTEATEYKFIGSTDHNDLKGSLKTFETLEDCQAESVTSCNTVKTAISSSNNRKEEDQTITPTDTKSQQKCFTEKNMCISNANQPDLMEVNNCAKTANPTKCITDLKSTELSKCYTRFKCQ